MDMLTNEMPLILFKQKMVLYWGDANHRLSFTTIDNTAEYTANVALEDSSPRYLRIAGDQLSPKVEVECAQERFGRRRQLDECKLASVSPAASPGISYPQELW